MNSSPLISVKRPLNWKRTLKRGQPRPKDDVQDGRLFFVYQPRKELGCLYERWITPEKLEIKKEYHQKKKGEYRRAAKLNRTGFKSTEEMRAIVQRAIKAGLIST